MKSGANCHSLWTHQQTRHVRDSCPLGSVGTTHERPESPASRVPCFRYATTTRDQGSTSPSETESDKHYHLESSSHNGFWNRPNVGDVLGEHLLEIHLQGHRRRDDPDEEHETRANKDAAKQKQLQTLQKKKRLDCVTHKNRTLRHTPTVAPCRARACHVALRVPRTQCDVGATVV